jgi:soluble lytic murein transglycosylase
MPAKKARNRLRKIIVFPPVLLLVLLILVYNPISVRLMTLGVAVANRVDPGMFYRLVSTESRFRSFAVSPEQAIGLAQVKESTAQYVHMSHKRGMLFIPWYNLRISARYIRYLQGRFNGNWSLVLAAYNWGEYNVERRMRGIDIDAEADYRERFSDIRETYTFISKIMPATKKA